MNKYRALDALIAVLFVTASCAILNACDSTPIPPTIADVTDQYRTEEPTEMSGCRVFRMYAIDHGGGNISPTLFVVKCPTTTTTSYVIKGGTLSTTLTN